MILAADLKTRFEITIDKVETGYFIDSEIADFINRAQESLFKELFNDRVRDMAMNGNFALKLEDSEALAIYNSPFFFEGAQGTIGTLGKLTFAEVDAVLGFFDDPTNLVPRKMFYPMSVRVSADGGQTYNVVRSVRHNQFYGTQNNRFFQAKDCRPIYKLDAEYMKLYPETIQYQFIVDALCYPPKVVIDSTTPSNNRDSYFDEMMFGELVNRAVQFAQAALRDGEGLGEQTSLTSRTQT